MYSQIDKLCKWFSLNVCKWLQLYFRHYCLDLIKCILQHRLLFHHSSSLAKSEKKGVLFLVHINICPVSFSPLIDKCVPLEHFFYSLMLQKKLPDLFHRRLKGFMCIIKELIKRFVFHEIMVRDQLLYITFRNPFLRCNSHQYMWQYMILHSIDSFSLSIYQHLFHFPVSWTAYR